MNKNKCNGLTLIEILVVIAVSGILFISLYTVFKSGADAWSKAKARLEIFQNARVVLDQLSRELPGAFVDATSATFTGEDGDSDPLVDGSPDKLEFITNFGGTIYKLKYELDPDTNKKILLRKYIKDPPDYANTDYENVLNEDDGIEESIVDFGFKMDNINFYYWDEVTSSWTIDGTWSDTAKLPKAVKIEIECIDSENKKYPFETVVYLPNSE
jgi:prepilin-type N-terminal cleavage/methylation domain-containing protein